MKLILAGCPFGRESYVITAAELGADPKDINPTIEMIILSEDLTTDTEIATIVYKNYTHGLSYIRHYTFGGKILKNVDLNMGISMSEVVYWRDHINHMEEIFAREEAMRDA